MGLGGFPLINFDDLTYPFGLYNLNVIVISSTAMIGVFFFYVMKININEFINGFKQINWNKKSVFKLMLVTIIILIVFGVIYLIVKNIKWEYPVHLTLYFVLFFFPIFLLFAFPKFKKEIIIGTWILTFVWGISLINYIVKDVTKKPANLNNYKLSFVYNKDTIGRDTADHYNHIGYKTIIMWNSDTKKYRIYPVEQVSNIEYGEIKMIKKD